jgi:hypothetical protein
MNRQLLLMSLTRIKDATESYKTFSGGPLTRIATHSQPVNLHQHSGTVADCQDSERNDPLSIDVYYLHLFCSVHTEHLHRNKHNLLFILWLMRMGLFFKFYEIVQTRVVSQG